MSIRFFKENLNDTSFLEDYTKFKFIEHLFFVLGNRKLYSNEIISVYILDLFYINIKNLELV